MGSVVGLLRLDNVNACVGREASGWRASHTLLSQFGKLLLANINITTKQQTYRMTRRGAGEGGGGRPERRAGEVMWLPGTTAAVAWRDTKSHLLVVDPRCLQ